MSTAGGLDSSRALAFEAARATVEEWRASGRRTTTAGVTSALKQAGVIDLNLLQLSSNREFWNQAAVSGSVQLEQQTNGHWLVLLPGEHLNDLVTDAAPNMSLGSSTAPPSAELRLKSDVWTAFVDWDSAFRRFWDRDHARAFMVPAEPDWVPPGVDETRFVVMEAVGQDEQVGWMRSFAEELPDHDRSAVLTSLADDAPRGAFRRELRERGLSRSWSATLQDHVVGRATTWAREAGVDVSHLVDRRRRDSEHAATSRNYGAARKPRELSPMAAISSRRDYRDDERLVLLRDRFHRVIDEMSWDELRELPVRAEHLIRF